MPLSGFTALDASFPTPDLKSALRSVLHSLLQSDEPAFKVLSRDETSLQSWFEPLYFDFDAASASLLIIFPHPLFKDWYLQQGETALRLAVDRLIGSNVQFVYKFLPPAVTPVIASSGEKHCLTPDINPKIWRQACHNEYLYSPGDLFLINQNQIFSSFFANSKNNFLLETLRASVQPNPAGNPVLLRGETGTGKTHLLKAAAELFTAQKKPACLMTAHMFSDLLSQTNSLQLENRKTIYNFAAIFIDDLDVIDLPRQIQEELSALVDHFTSLLKPVFFAISNCSLASFVNQLMSRLQMGIILDIAPPDLDIKMRYAQALLERYNIPSNRDVILNMSRRCNNMRLLEGSISRLSAYFSYSGQLPDREDLDIIVRSSGNQEYITPDIVISTVGTHFGFPAKDLRGTRRESKIVQARQVAIFLCRELLGESYQSLGRLFGDKDHSTAIYAVKKIAKLQNENKDVNILLTKLTEKCLANFQESLKNI